MKKCRGFPSSKKFFGVFKFVVFSLSTLLLPPFLNAANDEHSGRIEMRTVDCLNPANHNHPLIPILVDEKTNARFELKGTPEALKNLRPGQKVRVRGNRPDLPEQSRAPVEESSTVTAQGGGEIEVESTEILEEAPVAGGGEAVAAGGNSLTMLTTLLVFADSTTHSCMTNVTNARNLLFDNTNNANLGMQAITKGRYGLMLGNGTGVPEDHIIEMNVGVASSGYSSSQMESLIRTKLTGRVNQGGYGINLTDYNRILIFPPGGITDSSFTAYAYIYALSSSPGSGQVSVYGSSYGNSRMNGFLHELGHNFGFYHSQKTGTSYEYGDRTCVMGLSNDGTRTETYNAVKLIYASWLDAFTNAEVAVSTDTTFNLYPVSTDLDDPQFSGETIAVSVTGQNKYVGYHRNDEPYGYLSQSGDHDRLFVYNSGGTWDKSYQDANLGPGGSRSVGNGTVIFERYGPNNEYAIVSFDMDDGNTKPVANAQSLTIDVNTNIGITLTGSDADPADDSSLVFEVVEATDPAKGSLSGTVPNLTYTPVTDFAGEDSFVFSVFDGKIKSFATVGISVYSNAEPPSVDAGANDSATIALGETEVSVSLDGDVSDADGAAGGPVTTLWSVDSGPGSVTFGNASAIDTTVTFTQAGTYVLRLTADDIDFTSSDTVTLTIYDGADSDADGMEDNWEITNFGDLDEVGSGDFDGDGYTNLEEFTNDTDPTVDEAPAAPTGLVASFGDGQVSLDWDDNTEPDLVSYTVKRSTASGSGFTSIQTGLTSSSYVDSTVANGTEYFYVVTAVDANGGESSDSNEDSAMPLAGSVFIGNGVSGELDNLINNANNWNNGLPVSNNGIIPIDAKYDSNLTYTNYLITQTGGTFNVGAGLGNLRLGAGTDYIVNGSTARISGGVRGLTLTDAALTLIQGVVDVTANNSGSTVAGTAHLTVNGGTMDVAGLYFKGGDLTVTGGTFDASGGFYNNHLSGSSSVLTFNGGATTVVGGLTSQSTSLQMQLHFGGTAPGSVSFGGALTGPSSFDWSPGTKMTLTISGADEWAAAEWAADRLLYDGQSATDLGKSWVQVTAVDGLASGTRFVYDSNTETLSLESPVGPTAPLAPSGLSATGADASISLSWADNSDNETGFIVQRSDTSGGSFSTLTTTAADATSYTDIGLAAGTEYFYKVIATNAGGDSDPTNEASATTFTESEAWRDQYFGQTTNDGNAADTMDYDGDGITNLLERAFGTAPNDSGSRVSMPEGEVADDGGTDYPCITYRRLAGGTGTTGVDYTVDGITYTVEYDTDLAADPWNSGLVTQVGNAVDNGDGTETVMVRLNSSVGSAARQFIRLRVTSAP